ncbi:N-6 DNA methylase [Zavarzinia compransoris]|uniref:type ISP restriction/modification enzyme n=1 Tax=Zavarzinia marina TaxID=2911065 RepID=UPI001F26F45C|nr:type ISP restriction/modification enzyme [Zavarzinia marina]MCF4164828.1 N-6 DNA methylase [Zavarzinia marina]
MSAPEPPVTFDELLHRSSAINSSRGADDGAPAPTCPDLCARAEPRSRFARLGLHESATTGQSCHRYRERASSPVDGSFKAAISAFGAGVKAKLGNPAITGGPEDQLRAPLETLMRALGEAIGLPPDGLVMVGETSLGHLLTRPDFAVSVNGALVGFIEVKAPGKGFDPRRFTDRHDKAQWDRLKSLPNLLYTDGNGFSLWRDGQLATPSVAFDGDIETAGARLSAPETLGALIADFLTWQPTPPTSAPRLAEVAARLCRLLRDEVAEQMDQGNASLLHLRDDWRKLLFPEADNAQFADGYAQAVTFGLLIARALEIPLDDGIDLAAVKLRHSNTLIGTALGLLTDDTTNQEALKTALGTLQRVLNAVNWSSISKGKPDTWLYFYEEFLDVYDSKLRKLTGSYYTPPEVVRAMVRLVDEALRGPLFVRTAGLAASDVTVADPAVGTGTFLLGVLRKIAETVTADQGAGAVHGAIDAAARRLFGFEKQFGPFAVAQLRLLAELRDLTGVEARGGNAPAVPNLNLFITDTLGNPYVEEEQLPQFVEAIARSRREANRVKKEQPITVVIGNPPYKEKAEGRGGWIEQGSDGRPAPLDRWRPPPDWGVGAHGKHLKNLYVYFWRWATLKVFGAGLHDATALPETDEEGLICFITVAGFLNGPGFQKMRADLRRTCTAIWVIDCSPEGHQPPVQSRIFQGVQHPVCIVLAARRHGTAAETPATVWFHALSKGRREEKFAALETLSLTDNCWEECPRDDRAPFLPRARGLWGNFAPLTALFDFAGPGVMPGRTWVVAPDRQSLQRRWAALQQETDEQRKENLFHPQLRQGKVASRHIGKIVHQNLGSIPTRPVSIKDDTGSCPTPLRYAFRSFDRQWLIGDPRLLNDPRPRLWSAWSEGQVFLTALDAHSPTSGPPVTLAGLVPDQHHYKGSFGGRVFPLWADAAATRPNLQSGFLTLLAEIHGHAVSAEDALAYIAAVMAHPAFTARFAEDLVRPGLRLPVTADAALFAEAVSIGREVIWLHCHGERFSDADAGRPRGAPRLPAEQAPRIPADGAIPGAPAPLPDTMTYDAGRRRLHVGQGFVDNVTPAMWAYEISGKPVVWQWFGYRRLDRSKPIIGDRRPPSKLDQIQPDGWLHEYTSDLLDLLHILGRLVALEPTQAGLLARICDTPLVALDRLRDAGLDIPNEAAEED